MSGIEFWLLKSLLYTPVHPNFIVRHDLNHTFCSFNEFTLIHLIIMVLNWITLKNFLVKENCSKNCR